MDSVPLLGVVCISASRDIKKDFLSYWTVQLYFPSAVLLTYKRTMVILDYLHPLFAMFSTQTWHCFLNPLPFSNRRQRFLDKGLPGDQILMMSVVQCPSRASGRWAQLLLEKLWILTQGHLLNLSNFQESASTDSR